jgi:hypothetical protein
VFICHKNIVFAATGGLSNSLVMAIFGFNHKTSKQLSGGFEDSSRADMRLTQRRSLGYDWMAWMEEEL